MFTCKNQCCAVSVHNKIKFKMRKYLRIIWISLAKKKKASIFFLKRIKLPFNLRCFTIFWLYMYMARTIYAYYTLDYYRKTKVSTNIHCFKQIYHLLLFQNVKNLIPICNRNTKLVSCIVVKAHVSERMWKFIVLKFWYKLERI